MNYTLKTGTPTFLRLLKLIKALSAALQYDNADQRKWLMRINTTAFLLFMTIVSATAGTFAQKLTFSKKQASYEEIFRQITIQTGYNILYAPENIQVNKKLDVDFKDAGLKAVLDQLTAGQRFEYTIDNLNIIIKPKDKSLLDRIADVFNDIGITGRVLDEQGYPISGVNVAVKGSNRRASTDKDGRFLIKVQKVDDILVFTSLITETKELTVGKQTIVTITLKAKTNALDEVTVNTGFQSIDKERMTGATVTITSDELQKRYMPNILDNLEGRVAGFLTYNGRTMIRGTSTIQIEAEPLIVVDGLPINGTIADINPFDVETVTVLKDAAAASMYGIRASNGIIVITTKRAKKNGTTVDFASNLTLKGKPDLYFNSVSSAQQVDLESSYYDYYFSDGKLTSSVTTTENAINNGNPVTDVQYAYYQRAKGLITTEQLAGRLTSLRQNDFYQEYSDHVLQKDLLQQYNFSVRSKSDKFQSSLVLNYKNNLSGIINSYDKQLNIFYKGTYNVTKWLDVNFGVNTVLGKEHASNSSVANRYNNVSSYERLLDENGNRLYYTTSDYNKYSSLISATPQLKSMLVNHLDEAGKDFMNTSENNSRYYVNMDVKLFPGLTFRPQFQYERNTTNTSNYSEEDSYATRFLQNSYTSRTGTAPNYVYTYLIPTSGGSKATTNTYEDYWSARAQADYNHQFGKNYITVIAGTEFRETKINGTKGLLLGYDDQLQSQSTTSVNFNAIANFQTNTLFKNGYRPSGIEDYLGLINEQKHRQASGYANATYSYDRRYSIFGSLRKDVADVFGLDAKLRGKPLWSIGLAWNVTNESFMPKANWLNMLKLRATYGVTGNMSQSISSHQTAVVIRQNNPSTNLPRAQVGSSGNPELRWEKTTTPNIGFDFGLFDNRLNGTFDYYRKKGTDLFARQRLDPSEGFPDQLINNGGLVNNGYEVMLNYKWFKASKSGFSWNTSLNYARNKNKITYVDEISTSPGDIVGGAFRVGYPVHSVFAYQYKGLNEVGQPQWLDGQGQLTTEYFENGDLNAAVYEGSQDPVTTIYLTNELNFKGFSLNILMAYLGGNYLRGVAPTVVAEPSSSALPSYILNSWTPQNTNTIVPGWGQFAPPAVVPSQYIFYSDTFVYKADQISIRSVVLGYQLPQKWLARTGLGTVGATFQLNDPKALWNRSKQEMISQTSYVFGINFTY